jgi:hypothetical protein
VLASLLRGVAKPQVKVLIGVSDPYRIAMAALFNPTLRAVREQLYQSERPWIVDSSKFEHTFGWTATPLPDAIAPTVAWFRNQATA